jgi:hypothetical protein
VREGEDAVEGLREGEDVVEGSEPSEKIRVRKGVARDRYAPIKKGSDGPHSFG